MIDHGLYKRCPCCGTTEHLGEFVRDAPNGAILQFVACASCGAFGDVGLMDAVEARNRWNRGPIQIRAEVA
ncbi:Lar family restriction alleviation protein [Collinsella aerofaciens]|uniref:Lar family restriction alleviation protein n=1 Tax=Collinsella aerofaciens TaxID=74426 RepID=UPI001D0F9D4D|nr:Lar family restriction alleviation protein [Collinsella aerofaciens]MCC2803186.1 Lar family restriction alleviation protein [Collinsella aerofaciens]